MAKNYSTNLNLNANLNAKGMTKGINTVNKQLGTMRGSLETTERAFIRMAQRLASVYIIAQTAKTAFNAITFPAREGFEFNKVLDEQVTALTALTVATSQDVDSLGNRIDLTEKYTMAQKESLETMEKLKVINQTTPHNLAETAKIYKTLYAQAKATGSSTEEMVQATQALSLASKAGGIDLTTLLKSIDSLGTGTYLANSEFGKFAEALGVSRERMKALAKEGNGKALQYFLQQVEQLNVKTDAWAVHVAQVDNAWNTLTGKMTEDVFKGAKKGLDAITKSLTDIHNNKDIMEGMKELTENFYITSIKGANALASAMISMTQIAIETGAAFKQTANYIESWFNNTQVGQKIVDIAVFAKDLTADVFTQIEASATKFWNNMSGGSMEANNTITKAIKQLAEESKKAFEMADSENDAISATAKRQVENLEKVKKMLEDIKDSTVNGIIDARNEPDAEGGDDKNAARLLAKLKEEAEKTAAETEKALKKIETLKAKFNDDFQKATLSTYDYERNLLEKQASEYDTVIKDKARVDKWYQAELAKINALELEDYNKKEEEKRKTQGTWLMGLEDALDEYKTQSANAYESSKNLFTNAFGQMEDALVDFVKTGKMNFSDLADSIISDLLRMTIQQSITAPLMGALSGGVSSFFGGLFNAHGNAFVNGQVQAFANGGVVSSPTFFGHSGGMGVAGEAGSEAIMPLVRHGADLGVKSTPSSVVLNITNNSGNEISAEQVSEMTRTNQRGEQEKVINIVMDGVARNKNGIRDMLKGM